MLLTRALTRYSIKIIPSGGSMPTQVLMPQLGESVVEGTITRWLKQTGDAVAEFEPLVEINTDKVDSEIPSPCAGVLLEILIQEGANVQAGTLLALIGEAGESSPGGSPPALDSNARQAASLPADTLHSAASPRDRKDLGFISPVVARIASEEKIDLVQVNGTGLGGRITKKDLERYLEQRRSSTQPSNTAAAPPKTAPPPAAPPPDLEAGGPPQTPPRETIPHTPVRRAIAEHMVVSKHTSPHVTTIMEADLSRVIAHRQANKPVFARDGVNLTFTPYFVTAAVAALRAYPRVNSTWTDDGILLHAKINIGIATSLGEEGLIVPVVQNADSLSLLGLARSINDLASRARGHKLMPDEVKGGTFTITNHGISGSLFATPIINQPQCGILGVGAIQKRVVVISDANQGDGIAIRPMVYLGLTFDHRILDGAIADYFLAKVVESLQNWSTVD
jgi:2-oxoglutarate dehydrogenase E2 component (dihydrolipoamide succinyltransferase)